MFDSSSEQSRRSSHEDLSDLEVTESGDTDEEPLTAVHVIAILEAPRGLE
jgi:hypothetical protein